MQPSGRPPCFSLWSGSVGSDTHTCIMLDQPTGLSSRGSRLTVAGCGSATFSQCPLSGPLTSARLQDLLLELTCGDGEVWGEPDPAVLCGGPSTVADLLGMWLRSRERLGMSPLP